MKFFEDFHKSKIKSKRQWIGIFMYYGFILSAFWFFLAFTLFQINPIALVGFSIFLIPNLFLIFLSYYVLVYIFKYEEVTKKDGKNNKQDKRKESKI